MPESKLNVKLLKYTFNPEETVAQAAKLCYSKSSINDLEEKINSNDQSEFIENLMEMGHFSPTEHVSFTFGIEGISRNCSHQLVRHRLASYSQKSQRYVKEVDFDYVIPDSIKNCKGLCDSVTDREQSGDRWFFDVMRTIQASYNTLLELGVPPEDARFLLPGACETKIIVTMNARELLHFFRHRCCNRAQWEIRAMAIEMLKLVKKVSPTIFKISGPNCVSDKCKEGKMSCGKSAEVREFFEK